MDRAKLFAINGWLAWLMVVGGAGWAAAQPPRTRTLTYDPQRQEWVEQPPPLAGTAEADLYQIRLLIKDEKYRKAQSQVQRFLKKHGRGHALYPEVLIARAEALIGRRQYDEAHNVLQAFLSEFGRMALTSDALRLEFVVAEAYLGGAKRKFLGLRILPAQDVGYRILDEISGDYARSEYAELAIKTKADHLFQEGEHSLAELEYGRLVKEYPQSRYHEFALGRSAQAALASFFGVDYDEAALIEAQDRLEEYQRRYPMAARRDRVNAVLSSIRESRAEKEFRIGRYYERTEHLASAIFQYRLVRRDWPDTIAAGKAAERLELLGGWEATDGASPNGS